MARSQPQLSVSKLIQNIRMEFAEIRCTVLRSHHTHLTGFRAQVLRVEGHPVKTVWFFGEFIQKGHREQEKDLLFLSHA